MIYWQRDCAKRLTIHCSHHRFDYSLRKDDAAMMGFHQGARPFERMRLLSVSHNLHALDDSATCHRCPKSALQIEFSLDDEVRQVMWDGFERAEHRDGEPHTVLPRDKGHRAPILRPNTYDAYNNPSQ